MTSESILERESNQLSNKEQNSIIAFKIIDGIKDILAEDHEQKQPLILSLNEKLIINLLNSSFSKLLILSGIIIKSLYNISGL